MYLGYYLNLDSNAARRAALEEHLARVGASGRYRRFPAVNGREADVQRPESLKPGSLGLWLTHERLLADCAGSTRHVHILEDDAELPTDAVARFESMLQRADQLVPDWDVIFTETLVPFEPQTFRALANVTAQALQRGVPAFVDMKPLFMAGATSMFLNHRSIAKFDALTRGQWQRGVPRDMYLRHLIRSGALKAQLTLPFLTTYSPELGAESDIRGSLDASHRMTDFYRRSFFIGAHHDRILNDMTALSANCRHDPMSQIYLSMLSFYLSDQWEQF